MTDTPLTRGIKEFNSGRYFDAHEIWEELWHSLTGPEKNFVQGLVQSAVAAHHRQKGNLNGARYLAGKALGRLTGDNPGVPIEAQRLLEWLEKLSVGKDPGDPPELA